MKKLFAFLFVALLFVGVQDVWAQGDVGSRECGAAQDACIEAIEDDNFKNHGKKVSACAKASNTDAGFDITDECHSCIVNQVARRIPIEEQENCGESLQPAICQNGAVELSTAPSGMAILCDDPDDSTCEQDMASLCPVDWDLCTHTQFNNRNENWNFLIDTSGGNRNAAVGEILCRLGGGAGHFTVPGVFTTHNLGDDQVFNCFFGSSRDTCEAFFGCNELSAHALCCASTSTCGNGIVEGPEELCDDGNTDETDDCLNTCTWRVPQQHGLSGTNCL